ncbi:MAG TPA: hypothetical protein VM223_01650 [Planctomycetota bacterium]|nr:hypothetical protein [Planctomycetota bacterium]
MEDFAELKGLYDLMGRPPLAPKAVLLGDDIKIFFPPHVMVILRPDGSWYSYSIPRSRDPKVVDPARYPKQQRTILPDAPGDDANNVGIGGGGAPPVIEDEFPPCTCTPECDSPCKGECGCRQCGQAWQDFLSLE